jgi:hypothetical protein
MRGSSCTGAHGIGGSRAGIAIWVSEGVALCFGQACIGRWGDGVDEGYLWSPSPPVKKGMGYVAGAPYDLQGF